MAEELHLVQCDISTLTAYHVVDLSITSCSGFSWTTIGSFEKLEHLYIAGEENPDSLLPIIAHPQLHALTILLPPPQDGFPPETSILLNEASPDISDDWIPLIPYPMDHIQAFLQKENATIRFMLNLS